MFAIDAEGDGRGVAVAMASAAEVTGESIPPAPPLHSKRGTHSANVRRLKWPKFPVSAMPSCSAPIPVPIQSLSFFQTKSKNQIDLKNHRLTWQASAPSAAVTRGRPSQNMPNGSGISIINIPTRASWWIQSGAQCAYLRSHPAETA